MAARLGEEVAGRRPSRRPRVTITPLRRRHLRSVLRIEQQVYPRPWSPALFTGEMAMLDSRVYVVAHLGGSVVGYSGLMLVLDDGHVTTVAVDPTWQRHGIASRMLLQLARTGIARGLEQLTLEVRMSNRGAQDLYRRFGFGPAGVRRRYYVDNDEDALVMWAHDIASPAYTDRLDGIDAGLAGTTIVEGFDTP